MCVIGARACYLYVYIMSALHTSDFVLGNATRMCGAGGVWADPDVIGCSSRVFFMVQVQVSSTHMIYVHVCTA